MGISYTERRTPMENSVWGDAPRGMLDTTPNTPEQLASAARVVRAWNVHPEVMLDMLGLLEVQP